jgi:ATP-dependent DNA helicase RecQ
MAYGAALPVLGNVTDARDPTDFLTRCLAVDLEVDPQSARIFAFAAVRHDASEPLVFRGGDLGQALQRLEAFASSHDHLIGHNILRFDLPHLIASRPRLSAMGQAPIDTLWLNPLAFPRNPYHHLVKHYHDGRLQAGHVNDPELDARLVFDVLRNQIAALTKLAAEKPEAVQAYHFLTTRAGQSGGFDAVFRQIRGAGAPSTSEANTTIRNLLTGRACNRRIEETVSSLGSPQLGWPLAYALSWILVAGGDSVMPPWVRAQFREAQLMVRDLRATLCESPDCRWCRERSNPKRALSRWFGFDAFRSEPVDETGNPLQERIVAEAMAGRSLLGILPTGTGKSVCYQIPALSRFDMTGALTVVISPLVALMADQVQGLARQGISSAATINGLLSLPERQLVLDRVRLGEAAILLISPEQLRSVSVRSVLRQREVGLWVLDEAHCVSKWGHDFRPDYRYVGRFIQEFSGDSPPAPLLCLTATATPEVVRDILDHFQSRLGVELMLLNGGTVRKNLSFAVLHTQRNRKLADILDVVGQKLPEEGASGAVVYCATRAATERVAQFLQSKGLAADRFHSGLAAEEKRSILERFRLGELRIIAATNAFGMGIDKSDIRLVVHADIPGSLESYLQEAGRAGRDQAEADCVLLFSAADVERQFSLSARSRLAQHEIGAILKALRRLNSRTGRNGEVIVTTGEIVREEKDLEFERDSATDDTRVKTAVSWLEESEFLTREENRVQVFPSSLRIRTLAEAEEILSRAAVTGTRRIQLTNIVRQLMNARSDSGVSTDDLSGMSGLTSGALRKALADLETLGIATNDTAVTIFLRVGIEDASARRFKAAAKMEADLIALLREAFPEADEGNPHPLHLAETCQALREKGHVNVRPDVVETLLRGIAHDGLDQDGGRGNIYLRKASRNTMLLRLQRTWRVLEESADLRRQGAARLLGHLAGRVPAATRGKDISVSTTLGRLQAELTGDNFLQNAVRDSTKLVDRALLWLHEQSIITIGKGLTIFRPAMTLHLRPDGERFTKHHFALINDHYMGQTIQLHIMAVYAEIGLISMEQAQQLSADYFVLDRDAFLRRWLPGRRTEIRRQTTSTSFKAIVEGLGNLEQQKIVSDDREQTNVLVLAGPGSGKTRVLVHRIAYLIRVRREDPRSILVLTYSRHAAAEIRERLKSLIGDDTAGVTVSTFHALAMRLVGASFTNQAEAVAPFAFDRILADAVRLLTGEGLSKAEGEALRETLIQGYRWILVDEYQDIGPGEYALIAAVAGRSTEDPDSRLSLFAVGDDDQNIFAFAGASIEFIRRFEEDYKARPIFITENYRSTRHIIDAANHVITPATGRMKEGRHITVDRRRREAVSGGALAGLDPVAQGRVQLLRCNSGNTAEAVTAIDELLRLAHIIPDWAWSRAAIIARTWRQLEPIRSYAEAKGIPVELANETLPSIWRLREMQTWVGLLRSEPTRMLNAADLLNLLSRLRQNRWTELIAEGIATLSRELGGKPTPAIDIIEWFAEWARDTRGAQRGLLLLTAHRAKGLEFDDVVILNGGWNQTTSGAEDADAPRRLFYVAMTRARRSLAVVSNSPHSFLAGASPDNVLRRSVVSEAEALAQCRQHYQPINPRMVDLSYAGHLQNGHPALDAIANASVGDPVTLMQENGVWLICDPYGKRIGRMANAFTPPPGTTFLRGEIGGFLRWRKIDNSPRFQTGLKRDEWDVVLPELVFI